MLFPRSVMMVILTFAGSSRLTEAGFYRAYIYYFVTNLNLNLKQSTLTLYQISHAFQQEQGISPYKPRQYHFCLIGLYVKITVRKNLTTGTAGSLWYFVVQQT